MFQHIDIRFPQRSKHSSCLNNSRYILPLRAHQILLILSFSVYVANPSNGAVEPNLGAACPFIGVGSSIANTVTTSIGGDLASTGAIAGMSLTLDPSGYFYTSNQVSGKVYMPYANGTIPSQATNAETAIRAAYDQATGEPFTTYQAGAVVFDGMTFLPGV